VEDTVVLTFDLNYEGWPFHDWVDYVWDLFSQLVLLINLSIVKKLPFVALRNPANLDNTSTYSPTQRWL